MLEQFLLNDPHEECTRCRGQTNGLVARWEMTATFPVNRSDGSLPPDTQNLSVFDTFLNRIVRVGTRAFADSSSIR